MSPTPALAIHTWHMLAAVVAVAGFWAPSSGAAEPPCAAGWFGIQATVVRIHPVGGKLVKRTVDGRTLGISTRGVLCTGETLLFPAGS